MEKGKNSLEATQSEIQSNPINAELKKHEQMLKQELSKALNQEESFAKKKSIRILNSSMLPSLPVVQETL